MYISNIILLLKIKYFKTYRNALLRLFNIASTFKKKLNYKKSHVMKFSMHKWFLERKKFLGKK